MPGGPGPAPGGLQRTLRGRTQETVRDDGTKPDGEKAAIYLILEAQRKGEISEDNLLYIVENINVAAIETMLWSIEGGVAELVNNPDIQTRVSEELDHTLGKGNLITELDTYNPKHWDQPGRFMPERFSGNNIEVSGGDFRFLPFGSGRRSCRSIIIAMPLLTIVLSRLVQSMGQLSPPGMKKVDVAEKGGQFSRHIATRSTMVCKPIA